MDQDSADQDSADDFAAEAVLARIDVQTARLLETAAALNDAEVREPSLLPGWSRGHVLTHLARNADGGTRLLTWARTGLESYEYPSVEARADEIEAGAGRGAAELLADLRTSTAAFAEAGRRMPPDAWGAIVRWTTGEELPAESVATSRLYEVLMHHVDLDYAFTPADWPADFSGPMLGRVAAALGRRDDVPRMRLLATTDADTDASADSVARYELGEATPDGVPVEVEGTQSALLAWLTGRSSGADLTVRGGADGHGHGVGEGHSSGEGHSVGEGHSGGRGLGLPVVPKLS